MNGQPGAPVIEVRDAGFRYAHGAGEATSLYGPAQPEPEPVPATPALTDVDLAVPRGHLVLVCGGSGSGKSTVLRLLNGLVPHFHDGSLTGSVRVCGVDVPHADLSEAGRVSATVFQNPRTQFFTTDVRSELAFRAENYGVDPEAIVQKSAAVARELGITGLLDRRLEQLSGGELQKVACAQALAADTEVLLFDEPTSNLAPDAIDDLAMLLRRLRAQGRTIVVVEHRLYFLRGLADEVVLMEHGRLARRWTGEDFFALDPEVVAGFGLRTVAPPRTLGLLRDACAIGSRGTQASAAPVAPVAPAQAGLVLERVRFRYGRRRVLDIGSLHFPSGQVNALVGPNGAGKSTLARVISGLARPGRGGRILLDGVPVGQRARLAASSMVMQDVHRQLFSETVRAEVTLGLPRAERAGLDVEGLLAQFDLADLADRHPLSLSGGQKQRLVLAAACARTTRVHIFDEPTSGVDRRHLDAIAAHLRELAGRGGIVIVITHDPELIDACATSITILDPLAAAGPQQVETWPLQAFAGQRDASTDLRMPQGERL